MHVIHGENSIMDFKRLHTQRIKLTALLSLKNTVAREFIDEIGPRLLEAKDHASLRDAIDRACALSGELESRMDEIMTPEDWAAAAESEASARELLNDLFETYGLRRPKNHP